MRIGFKVTNDGAKVRIHRFIRGFSKAKKDAARVLADSFMNAVKMAILNQTLAFAPLSEKWAASKDREGLDSRILVATKEYVESYRLVESGDDGYRVEGDGERMRLLEYGTGSMPARPHIAPGVKAARAAKPQAIKVFRDLLGR